MKVNSYKVQQKHEKIRLGRATVVSIVDRSAVFQAGLHSLDCSFKDTLHSYPTVNEVFIIIIIITTIIILLLLFSRCFSRRCCFHIKPCRTESITTVFSL